MFKRIVILIVSLISIYLGIFLAQNYFIQKSFEVNYQEEKIKDTQDFIRCNSNMLNPKYAFIFDLGDGEDKHIAFYESNKLLFQKEQDWAKSSTGGTTIKNTTFPELVKMVKEDCSQFQEDFDAEDPETQMDWGYREAEPPKTEEELAEEEVEGRRSYIRSLKYRVNELFTDLQKEKFTEFYGDVNSMTDDEVYNIAQQLAENDGIVDESLYEYFYSEYDLKYMRQ